MPLLPPIPTPTLVALTGASYRYAIHFPPVSDRAVGDWPLEARQALEAIPGQVGWTAIDQAQAWSVPDQPVRSETRARILYIDVNVPKAKDLDTIDAAIRGLAATLKALTGNAGVVRIVRWPVEVQTV